MPVITQEQLDELIAEGKRLRELTRYFQHRSEAFSAYATRQHFYYNLQSAVDEPTCCACRNDPSATIVEYRWQAVVLAGLRVNWLDLIALWLFRFTIPRVRFDCIGFRTYHPFCARCRRYASVDERVAGPFSGCALGAILLGLLFIVFGLMLRKLALDEIIWLVAIGVLLFVCAWLAFQAMHYLRTPKVLREISRRPFRYQASHSVEDVASEMLDALEPPERHLGVEALELKRLRKHV